MKKRFRFLAVFTLFFTQAFIFNQVMAITVTNGNDSGPGSFREAVSQFDGTKNVSIFFSPSVTTITLTSTLTIGYAGAPTGVGLIIDGLAGRTDKVGITYPNGSTNDPVLSFSSPITQIASCEIYGNTTGDGIRILSRSVTVKACTIRNNAGNGIFASNSNNLSITNNRVYSNGRLLNNASSTSGIRIEQSTSNLTIESNIIGSDNLATLGLGNGCDGITLVGVENAAININYIVGNGNLNNFVPGGGGIAIKNTIGNGGTNILGTNYIGLSLYQNNNSSAVVNGNYGYGISVEQSNDNRISSNIIYATQNGPAIYLRNNPAASNISGSSRNVINYNRIGFDNSTGGPNPTKYANLGGIYISGASNNNKIGDPSDSTTNIHKGNIICNNKGAAITIDGTNSANQNTIFDNAIFCNVGYKGIALINNGNASIGQNQVTINLSESRPSFISGTAPANSLVDVYVASTTCTVACATNAATNYRQGGRLITSVTANANGQWELDFTSFPDITPTNAIVTATDSSGSTSEFSICQSCITPKVSQTVIGNSVCQGSAASINIFGAEADVTYQVLNASNTVIAGPVTAANAGSLGLAVPAAKLSTGSNIFTVQAKGSGCASFTNMTNKPSIIVNPKPDSTTTINQTTLTASKNAAVYAWFECSNTNNTLGTNQSFTPTASGDFAVKVTANGCTSTSLCKNINVTTTDLIDVVSETAISIYPNPASDLIHIITAEILTKKVLITDLHGNNIYEKTISDKDSTISTEAISNGIYLLNIVADGKNETHKLVIVK